jgi:hypothetical protein
MAAAYQNKYMREDQASGIAIEEAIGPLPQALQPTLDAIDAT